MIFLISLIQKKTAREIHHRRLKSILKSLIHHYHFFCSRVIPTVQTVIKNTGGVEFRFTDIPFVVTGFGIDVFRQHNLSRNFVCRGLIEIIYQLRNHLFHGELNPTEDI